MERDEKPRIRMSATLINFGACTGPNCRVMGERCEWQCCGVCCRRLHSTTMGHTPAPVLNNDNHWRATRRLPERATPPATSEEPKPAQPAAAPADPHLGAMREVAQARQSWPTTLVKDQPTGVSVWSEYEGW